MTPSLTTLAPAFQAPYTGPLRRGILPTGEPVLVRFAAADDGSARAALANARALASSLPRAVALRPLALTDLDGRPALAIEDVGQRPLSLAPPVCGALGPFLARAEALTTALAATHDAGIIHRALSPNVFWLSPEGHCWLSGFDEATRLAGAPAGDPAAAGPRLPYLAPEQTGRMNRTVDQRADLYALGMILAAEWSGQLPLQASDLSGWIHAHVARRPDRLDAPAPLAALVERLLAKAPEDRYQTAAGLLADLRLARKALAAGALSEFKPTGHSFRDRFRLPQGLFGRDAERDALTAGFHAAAGGAVQVCLVTGPVGIGKSRLIAELQPITLRRRGLFAEGRASRYARERPYAALAEAIDDLIHQALTRPVAEVSHWVEALGHALGPNGRVLVGFAPAAAHLLGPTPPVPPLEAEAARLRLAETLGATLRLFARPAHPVVLALDDLQWADPATLDLLERILLGGGGLALQVVAGFRDAGLRADHPLWALRDRLATRGHALTELPLTPLTPAAVEALVAAAVEVPPAAATPLAEVVRAKTEANPFFIARFLQGLHDDGLLRRDPGAARWRWDLTAVQAAPVTDNVIELMAARIRRLPEAPRALLVQGAVVGPVIDVDALAALRDLPPADVARGLAPAVAAGLLVPLGEAALRPEAVGAGSRFRFVHDRVHEAARSLVPPAERVALHRAVARNLQARLGDTPDDERLFDLADHLSHAAEGITEPGERRAAAELLLRAAERARAAGAHELARGHAEAARDLLGPTAWDTAYPLALALHLLLADALRLAGDAAGAHHLAHEIERRAHCPLDRVGAQVLRAQLLINELQVSEAARIVLTTCADLGFPVPVPPDLAALQASLQDTVGRVLALGLAGLAALPPAPDPTLRAALRVLGGGLPGLAMGLRDMHPSAALHGVELSLRHGVAPGSATAFSHLGILLCATGHYAAGVQVGRISEALRRRDLPEGTTEGLVEHLAFIHHWQAPFRETADGLAAGARRALELGDPNVFGYCVNTRYLVRILAGEPLADLDAEFSPTHLSLLHHSQDLAALSAALWGQTVTQLRDGGPAPARLVGDRFDAVTIRPKLAQAPPVITAYMACATALLGLSYDDATHALATLEADAETLADPAVAPAVVFPAVVTYRAVAACEIAARHPERRATLEARIEADLPRLEAFAASAPHNHRHRLALVRAEHAALRGDIVAAMDGFTEAADLARLQGFVHDEALAHHRAGRFHLRAGRLIPARGHLREAIRAYTEWGALSVAAHLQRRSADLLGDGAVTSDRGQSLDVQALLAAAETLGAQSDLEQLLKTLMELILRDAAAERGVLLLERDDHLQIAAEARPDGIEVLQGQILEDALDLPIELIHFVARTGAPLELDDARESRFAASRDVKARGIRAVLCLPLIHQGQRLAVLYLENTLTAGAFTPARTRLVHAIAAQGAIALQNALLLAEAREATARLEQQNQRLTEVDRLRDAFLAKTSHELRTPLNGIIGLARTLLDGAHGPLAAPVRGNLDMIATSGRRLANLINDLLDFSALREGALSLHLGPTDVAEIIDRSLAILQPLLDAKGLAAAALLPDDLPLALADAERVEQIILNLLGNAIKFTDRGRITARAHIEDDQLRVEISDTGPGIPAELHERIFQAFDQGAATGDTGRGGTGLGLPIARQLIEAQGGRVGVRSVVGEGSTFYITLPLARGVDHLAHRSPRRPSRPTRPVTVTLEPISDAPRPGDGARILVVDDEPINLQVVLQHLQPQGFTVHTALGGRSALDRLEGGLNPDAIILDVMMPDLDGLAVTEAIRRSHPGAQLPILLLTAKTQTADLLAGLGAGANDYVTKPVDGPELIARLRTHLTLSRFSRAMDRFVPHAFVDALGRGSLTELSPGESKALQMTVLFADMHGFGALTRGWEPSDSFRFINQYLAVLEPAITAHGGFVDKYMGDTVMALFPGPLTDAVAAAVAMQRAVQDYNQARRDAGRTPIRLGVGVHRGQIILGTVGNHRRMDTTVISEAVNHAATLEQRSKRLRAGILVGGEVRATLEAAGHRLRLIDHLHTEPVFEIFDADPPGGLAAKTATQPIFERAVRAFHDRAFGEAERLFQVCRALDPADPAARDYAARCERVRRSIDGGGW